MPEPPASIEIAPGVRRLGSSTVNFYLVLDSGKATVVDAGVPGYWSQLEPALNAAGLDLDDVSAVLLTHAHSDHTGVAGHLHERGVTVHLHSGDHELLATGKEPWKRERGAFPQVLRPGVWPFFFHMLRNGALKPPKITDPEAIADGDVVDIPGRPRVLQTPGHTPGHCVFHFETARAVFVGDLLCTWNPLSGSRGPQIMPGAFNVSSDQCLESLGVLEDLDVDVILPGHGEPWTDGAAAAVARAREAGKS
jgi:glyoxylase-like metal-dependent hydrolase (beta-lactamase superfamily II)